MKAPIRAPTRVPCPQGLIGSFSWVSALRLRLGWPAREWETGPEPKLAEKWLAKWPAAIFLGGGGGPKMAGQMAGHAENHQILAVWLFARPFFGLLGTPPKMAAGHFAGHFSAIFGSVPVSHSVELTFLLHRDAQSRRPPKGVHLNAIMSNFSLFHNVGLLVARQAKWAICKENDRGGILPGVS